MNDVDEEPITQIEEQITQNEEPGTITLKTMRTKNPEPRTQRKKNPYHEELTKMEATLTVEIRTEIGNGNKGV